MGTDKAKASRNPYRVLVSRASHRSERQRAAKKVLWGEAVAGLVIIGGLVLAQTTALVPLPNWSRWLSSQSERLSSWLSTSSGDEVVCSCRSETRPQRDLDTKVGTIRRDALLVDGAR